MAIMEEEEDLNPIGRKARIWITDRMEWQDRKVTTPLGIILEYRVMDTILIVLDIPGRHRNPITTTVKVSFWVQGINSLMRRLRPPREVVAQILLDIQQTRAVRTALWIVFHHPRKRTSLKLTDSMVLEVLLSTNLWVLASTSSTAQTEHNDKGMAINPKLLLHFQGKSLLARPEFPLSLGLQVEMLAY